MMASTSTQLQDGASLSSVSSFRIYDVFLSFRGEDTRNNFVDHLYSALHQVGIFMYKDDLKLERGESISPALLKAIEDSKFAVVVFSKDYASSKWCLDELVKILQCQKTRGLTVLPVFYEIDPSDLRKQKGSVGKAFAKHEQDSNEEEKQKVQIWKNALMEAANISGWDSKKHGPEAKLVRNIAIHILKRLGDDGSSVLEDVVGLYPRIEKVMSLLEMGLGLDDPRIVGLCGMGGIGKTTIAKAVYYQIRSRFHASCYLPNVREATEKRGLESLQKFLLSDIFSIPDSEIKIRNLDEGRSMIKNRARCKRVLIVLDDVDQKDQLEALFGKLDWFGLGSRVIITTRNSHLLKIFEVKGNHVYNIEQLNHEDALELFCCKAFRKNQPTQGYERLTNSVIHYAGGVPLALQVLGSFLFGRSIIEWRSAVDRLTQQPNAKIQEVFKLSYDGLEREEKEIFLDIACFFKGKSKDYAIDVLNACGFHADIGISVLEDKALVTITHNQIGMHDLIQRMGCHIVNEEFPKEPGKRSRLWKYKDIYDTLKKKTGTAAVEAIVLDSHETKEISLSPDAFSEMNKLRLLKLSNVQLPNGLNYLSNDLCLLDWDRYPLKYLPSNFLPDCLVKLKLSRSCLKQLWNGRRMYLNKLKYVDLSYSPWITKILDFTWVTNLKKLILEDCTNLVEISPSIEASKRIMYLNLRGCKYLKVLPTGCWLKSLERLILSGCSKLQNVSEVLAFTECLIHLDLDGTCLKELPVEHLSNLRFISLRDCKKLKSLPSGICGLKLLQCLIVSGCSKLSKLPENLGGLQRLQQFDADFTAIKQLPSSIVHMKELMFLSLNGCKGGVTSTPRNSLFSSFLIPKERQDPMGFELPPLSGLCSLWRLYLRNCNFSKGFLPDDLGSLPSLYSLDLSGSNIIGLPASIGYLPRLSHLMLKDCKKLKTLPYLPTSISLIDASGCTSLEIVTDLFAIIGWDYVCIILINCHTLAKNQPDLHIQLIRNLIKNIAHLSQYSIVFPGREIPKYFSYQNNMGHYIRFQLMPDWCQRLRGFVVCVVFESKAPIDAQVSVECYGICNDVVDYAEVFWKSNVHFGSDHFFFIYRRISDRVLLHLKICSGMMFYFTSSRPKMVVPVKCGVEMIDEEGQLIGWKRERSCYDSDYNETDIREQSNSKGLKEAVIQLNDSQFELSEIQNIRNSVKLKNDYYIKNVLPTDRRWMARRRFLES